jgi:hypothetical protein
MVWTPASIRTSQAFGPEAMRGGDMKKQVEAIFAEEFRKVKHLIDQNRDAVIAIAEALILRNELTDIDVNDILARVEATHPFVNEPLSPPPAPLPASETIVDSAASTNNAPCITTGRPRDWHLCPRTPRITNLSDKLPHQRDAACCISLILCPLIFTV